MFKVESGKWKVEIQTVQKPTNKFSVKPFSKGLQGCGDSVPTIAAGALQPF